ncbi:MAG TPA: TetR/AcrR family transcriptional regulator [Kofleriaceae bacterium]
MADPRVRRSREQLHRALVALILERGWDRVSVEAVCERASVGRSTFYVHFADKEDCLIGGLEHVRDDLLRSQPREAFGFVRGLVAHAGDSRRMFRAVIGKRSGLAVQRRFREIVGELMTEDLRAQRIPERALATTSRFLAGALVELLLAWMDARDAANDVEQRFAELAAPVVAAVLDSRGRVSRKSAR